MNTNSFYSDNRSKIEFQKREILRKGKDLVEFSLKYLGADNLSPQDRNILQEAVSSLVREKRLSKIKTSVRQPNFCVVA
jgi:choline kinase